MRSTVLSVNVEALKVLRLSKKVRGFKYIFLFLPFHNPYIKVMLTLSMMIRNVTILVNGCVILNEVVLLDCRETPFGFVEK